MKFSSIQLIRFRGDKARVFQRVSINLNQGYLGVSRCPWSQYDSWSSRMPAIVSIYTQSTLATSCACWIVPIVVCKPGEKTCGWSYFICTWSV